MKKTSIRGLGAILLALVLAGCWPQQGYGPGNTRFNDLESGLTRGNVASLAEQWRTPIDSFVTEPIVSDGRIYVANRSYGDDGSTLDVLAVQAYDRATGELLWERSLLPADGSPVGGDVATPALEDGALWVPYWHDGLGPCDGRLARLDPATGQVLSSDATGTQLSAVVVAGSTVSYMEGTCGTGSRLVVRDQATRAIQWTYTFPRRGVVTPTIADGRLFVLTRGVLYGFAADGCGATTCNPVWTEDVGASLELIRLTAGPGGTLVTIGHSSVPVSGYTVVVRDGATGDVRWETEPRYTGSLPGAITGVAVADGTIYVSGARNTLEDGTCCENEAILDAYPVGGCGQAVCSPTWTAGLGPTRPAREPTVAGGVVYVPLVSTYEVAPALVAVDAQGCGAATCPEVTRVPLVDGGPGFISEVQSYVTSVADGGVFVGLLPGLYGETETELIAFGPSAS